MVVINDSKCLFLQRARADGGEREESNARERRRRGRVGLASKMWLDKIGAQRIDLLLSKAATNPPDIWVTFILFVHLGEDW